MVVTPLTLPVSEKYKTWAPSSSAKSSPATCARATRSCSCRSAAHPPPRRRRRGHHSRLRTHRPAKPHPLCAAVRGAARDPRPQHHLSRVLRHHALPHPFGGNHPHCEWPYPPACSRCLILAHIGAASPFRQGDRPQVAKPPQFAKREQKFVALNESSEPICVERFSDYPQRGRFTLRDEGKTVAIRKVIPFALRSPSRTSLNGVVYRSPNS